MGAPTAPASAASSLTGRTQGVVSKEARSVAYHLLDAPVGPRRAIIASLDPRELTHVLNETRRTMGTPYALWRDTPSGFTEDVIGETTWSKQRQVMDAIVDHKRVAVPAGFGLGKTFLGGRLVSWAGAVNPVGTIVIVTTATRFRQVRYQLWPHIRTAVTKAGIAGQVDTTQWKMPDINGNDVVVAYGFSAPDNDEAAMQGIHGCYSSDVEVLTDEGWKFFPDVRGDERVMSLRADGVAEWGPITEVTNVEIDGYLNVHDGDRVNFSVTDGHRMLWSPMHYRKPDRLRCPYCQSEVGAKGRSQHEKKHLRAGADPIDAEWEAITPVERKWQLGSYMDLPQEFFVRRTNTWQGVDPGPITFPGTRSGPDLTFTADQLARFLGWYVAEGHVQERAIGKATRRTICVAQMQGEKYEQITKLLDEVGVRYVRTDHSIRFLHKQFALWLQEHCGVGSGEKRVPQVIKDAPQHVIRAFLDTYRMGDGTRHTHPDSARYVTSSKALADDVHELLVKMGTARKMRLMHAAGSTGEVNGRTFVRKRDVWAVTEAGRPADSNVKKANVRRVRHKGPVYCVTTPNETLMVRRGGVPMWCGNTPKLLLVVDEAGGISRMIGRGTNNLLTGDARMLAIGNPPMSDPGSWFESLCMEGESGKEPSTTTIRIAATDSPALTGEATPICRACVPNHDGHTIAGGNPSHLPDREWLDRTMREYGDPEHPYIVAKVYALFPKDAGNKMIPASWVELAHTVEDPTGDGWVRPCDLGLPGEGETFTVKRGAWVRLGIDVAAAGGDEFVISRAVGDAVSIRHTSSGKANADSTTVSTKALDAILQAQRLADALGSTAPVHVKVDVIGLGWGVVGNLKAWGAAGRHKAVIVPVNVSEAPRDRESASTMRPMNKRAEMWLTGRALLQPDPVTGVGRLRLRVGVKANAQLTSPNLLYTSTGLVVVEPKEKMKARGVPSPDQGESVLMAVYEPEPPAMRRRRGLLQG